MDINYPLLLLLASSAAMAGAVFYLTQLIEPLWDQVTARYVRDLEPMLEALSLNPTNLPQLMRFWGVTMAGSFLVIALALDMWPVAFIAVYLVYVAPRIYLNLEIARRTMLLRDQLVGTVTALANATRAGLSLAQGIDNVAAETPEPLGILSHVDRVAPLFWRSSDRSAPRSNRSFEMRCRAASMSPVTCRRAIPMVAFVSSTVPYAAGRSLSLRTRPP